MNKGKAFKVVIIGSPSVGKSSLLNRLTKNSFVQQYDVTLGAQFHSKVIQTGNNQSIKLQIWDTAGQQSFRSLVKTFYRGAAAVFLVYSIISEKSFKDLDYWYDEAQQLVQQYTVFGLIGTKKDRENQRTVSVEDAQHFMKERDIAFMFQTSAKTSQNVYKAFQKAAQQIIFKRMCMKINNTQNQTSKLNSIVQKQEKDNQNCSC